MRPLYQIFLSLQNYLHGKAAEAVTGPADHRDDACCGPDLSDCTLSEPFAANLAGNRFVICA